MNEKEMFDDFLPKMVSIAKAGKLLGVSPQTLRNWDASGKLKPNRTLGKHRRYLLSDIRNLLLNEEEQ